MTHTAGIQDFAPAAMKDYRQLMNMSLDEVVRRLAAQPLLFQPGTQWSYSSPGIEILGASDRSMFRPKIRGFHCQPHPAPARHEGQFFFPTPDKLGRIAMVYVQKDGKLVRAPATILGGDPANYRQGAIFPHRDGASTHRRRPAHFYRMMLNDGVYEGRRYLSPFSVHIMTEAHTTGIHPVGWMLGSDYGLAWEVVTDPLGELAGHSKGTYGTCGAPRERRAGIDPEIQLISDPADRRPTVGTDGMGTCLLNMAKRASASRIIYVTETWG